MSKVTMFPTPEVEEDEALNRPRGGGRDGMTDDKLSQIDYLAQTVEVLSVENEALRAENERLMKALKPFKEAAEDLDEDDKDEGRLWEHWAVLDLTVGDLRNCQKVYEGSTIE